MAAVMLMKMLLEISAGTAGVGFEPGRKLKQVSKNEQ